MPNLIKLTVSTRRGETPKPAAATIFDVDDIITPIRHSGTKSYFDARMEKGTVAGAARNNAKVSYQVSEALAAIQALSNKFLLLTVYKRRLTTITNELTLFNISRISETITQVGAATDFGTKFMYCEDGDPLPVEYYVRETEDQIIAQLNSNTSNITTLSYDVATEGATKNLSGYSGELIINVTSSDGIANTINGFTNFSGVTKITLRPDNTLNPLLVNDALVSANTTIKLSTGTINIFGPKRGFLELTKRVVGAVTSFYQTNIIDQYN